MSDPRTFYSLLTSSRLAIAVVRLQHGLGTDLAEVDFALRMLKRKLQRGGYYQDLGRVAIARKRKRRTYKKRRGRGGALRRPSVVRRNGRRHGRITTKPPRPQDRLTRRSRLGRQVAAKGPELSAEGPVDEVHEARGPLLDRLLLPLLHGGTTVPRRAPDQFRGFVFRLCWYASWRSARLPGSHPPPRCPCG